jgi:hypothetical protein
MFLLRIKTTDPARPQAPSQYACIYNDGVCISLLKLERLTVHEEE